ncbi:MAG: hypothetical protein CSA38_03450 [Flavobacteriales bacterium]|nr:MAG: hypothetical protein CSA38_03450 [Flavobacteriales bacterium]
MKITKRIALSVAVGFFSLGFAQSLEEGIVKLDSHKFSSAKSNFQQMVANDKEAENYFYYGNVFLQQFKPNLKKAEELFKKGLAEDRKSYLNRIGLASIRLAKGDKSAAQTIQEIVKQSRGKDAEVLYRAGEALILFKDHQSPELAVEYITKAIDRSNKKGKVPAHYYYTLGDAYRASLSTDPIVAGKALTAYEEALPIAKNKASVYTRMGTLWLAAERWQQGFEEIQKAIKIDKSYAPAYKALAGYYIRYEQNGEATQALMDYAKYADEDLSTQFEISKLFFLNEDYTNAKATLDKIFDKITDPIKYKLNAYLLYGNKEYAKAKQNLDTYYNQISTSEIIASDKGLEGLIEMGLAKDEQDEAKRQTLMAQAQNKVNIAKNAKDETLKWDKEMLKLKGGVDLAAVEAGAQSPKIQELKLKVQENPKNANLLVDLATEYQNVQNWSGAVYTWNKLIKLTPNWEYSYYAKGVALQQLENYEMAEDAYQKYIDLVLTKTPEEQAENKETMCYAYYLVAYMVQDRDMAKAKDYAKKAVELNPAYQDAVELNNQLNK